MRCELSELSLFSEADTDLFYITHVGFNYNQLRNIQLSVMYVI